MNFSCCTFYLAKRDTGRRRSSPHVEETLRKMRKDQKICGGSCLVVQILGWMKDQQSSQTSPIRIIITATKKTKTTPVYLLFLLRFR
ncbi:hypothetical protein LDENG_00160020 [Lucifuga dentata]|nr:hypothetical protein LDENG_00160020 [Lucifuga dentata]